MIKVSVMYPHSPAASFDMKYYLEKHMPMVGQKLGALRLSDYFARFGFGKPTGVDLAGEVTGTVRAIEGAATV